MKKDIFKAVRLPKSIVTRVEKITQAECSSFSQFIRTAIIRELNERDKQAA